jgi:hypothetical protein
MRVFIAACCVAAVIAIGAAVALDLLLQQQASVAFAKPSARP